MVRVFQHGGIELKEDESVPVKVIDLCVKHFMGTIEEIMSQFKLWPYCDGHPILIKVRDNLLAFHHKYSNT